MNNQNKKTRPIALSVCIIVCALAVGYFALQIPRATNTESITGSSPEPIVKTFVQGEEIPTGIIIETPTDELVMRSFFNDLHEGRYDSAIPAFDGLYDGLRYWNPTVSYYDLGTLWKNGCEMNGLNCLQVRDIISKVEVLPEEIFRDDAVDSWSSKADEYTTVYRYLVTFQYDDGSLFEQGPCCGEADDGTRTSEFEVLVGKKEGRYFVLSQPPYTP